MQLQDDVKAAHSFTSHQSIGSLQNLGDQPSSSLSSVASMPLPSYRASLQGVNGTAEAVPPHEAYSRLLDEWMPLLLEELDTCAEFLMLKADDPMYPSSDITGSKSHFRPLVMTVPPLRFSGRTWQLAQHL